ncbi:MAG: transglutaminase-like cysteine peptidase [Cohaesibacter sp.]|nr:transglutaminase-like cysteine peptidase [Cohaesibacter sp.]MCV6601012.1 transglutaminase-like cysteine peptidase [Cohaesibacter sp.]
MNTKLIATLSLAFAMVSPSAQAVPFSPLFGIPLERKVIFNKAVQPTLPGDLKGGDFVLRRSLPPLERENDTVVQERKLAMLKVFPLDRSWQRAALPEPNTMIVPPSIDKALAPIVPQQDMIILPRKKLKSRGYRGKLPTARRFNLRRNALAPMAYVEFCMRNKAQCATSRSKEVKLTVASLKTLKRVNFEINRAIRPRNEAGDTWKVNVHTGDCEDYALTKRSKLVKMGFPASALRMAVARTPYGEGHAVLVVSTNRGDFVLDNRNNEVRSFHRTDLTWEKIQGKRNPLLWHEI